MPFDALEPFDISPEIQCQELYLGRLRANPQVAVLLINRPTKGNAFTESMFNKFKQLIEYLEDSLDTLDIRVCVVYSRGKLFSAGIDIGTLNQIYKRFLSSECPGEAREKFRRGILRMQDSFTSMERLRCPVISCIQGPCIGGGVDLITAADIRVCNEAATFCVKEVDVGIVADLGKNPTFHAPNLPLSFSTSALRYSGEASVYCRSGKCNRAVSDSTDNPR